MSDLNGENKIDRMPLMQELLDISKFSYSQETERSKQLLTKSDNVTKYISVLFIFVNLFLPVIHTNKIISLKYLIIFYAIISIPLVLSLYFAVRAQVLKPGKFFPTGIEVIESMKTNQQLFDNIKLKNRHIQYFSSSTNDLQKSNDKRAKILKKAYFYYLCSIVIFTIILFIIMILINR